MGQRATRAVCSFDQTSKNEIPSLFISLARIPYPLYSGDGFLVLLLRLCHDWTLWAHVTRWCSGDSLHHVVVLTAAPRSAPRPRAAAGLILLIYFAFCYFLIEVLSFYLIFNWFCLFSLDFLLNPWPRESDRGDLGREDLRRNLNKIIRFNKKSY